MIQDGLNGFLVEPGKPAQLPFAICQLANDIDLRVRMGKANFQLVCEKYDIEHHVTNLVGIYNQAML
jgi:glycosyltransferase involved in cell wall biosynthesis